MAFCGSQEGDGGETVKRQKTEDVKVEREKESEEDDGLWQQNDEGDLYFDLKENGTRRVTVRKFKSMVGVDIREYYKDKGTGEMKPGRKGIYLTKDQYTVLREHFDHIDAQVHALERGG